MYIISPVQGIIDYTLPKSVHVQSDCGRNCVAENGAGMEGLKSLSHPAVWPNLKHHLTTSLAIIKNLTDFAQELSQMYEHHAEELQLLVGNYRKKNTEMRKDRGASSCMMQVWEGLLQEVEADAGAHSEIASVLGRQVSRHTLERTFHRKLQARKLLAHRESLDLVIAKAEETLSKCRQEYRGAWTAHAQSPQSTATLAAYLDAHNAYVTQLHATNAMVETYSKETLPELLQELEEVYADLCNTMSESVAQGAEIISNRTGAQSRRYCSMWSECKEMSAAGDTAALARSLVLPSQPHPTHRLRLFTPPQHDSDGQEGEGVQLKNEIVADRLASLQLPQRYEALAAEAGQLHAQIQHLQDALATMLRIQQRGLDSQLFNKANEIQEDISMKRYELRTARLNLAAVNAQKELFAGKVEMADGGSGPDRKMSTASTASMKSKWLKAFKSLKTPPANGSSPKEQDKDKKNEMYHAVSTIIAMRRNGKDLSVSASDSSHQFQEYTYKKITPCDVCSQVLRGHTRQGLKCRICKQNVHIDCQERAGKCQTKSRLLRRQKSSSEIETRPNPGGDDQEAGRCLGGGGRSVSPGGGSGSGERSRSVTFRTPAASTAASAAPDEEDRLSSLPQQTSPIGYPREGSQTHQAEDSTYRVLKTANEMSSKQMKQQHNARANPHSTSSDCASAGRRRRLFGMRSFTVFGFKSHDRAASLPETEQLQYAAGTRPFGQPLMLGGGAASGGGSPPSTPSPRPSKRNE